MIYLTHEIKKKKLNMYYKIKIIKVNLIKLIPMIEDFRKISKV